MNNSYILLRNNKESTSLNLDSLKQIGLKPTDLIWVECQSVCWQYPHEIPELKSLITDSIATTIEKSKNLSTNNDLIPDQKMIPEKRQKNKLVFVEFPATPDKKQPATESSHSDIDKYAGITSSEKISKEISTKYSRPLDEIKEMYIKNLESKEQSSKKRLGLKLSGRFQKILLYIGLVATGAAIMLFINNTAGKKSAGIAQEKLPQNTVEKKAIPTPVEVIPTIITEPVNEQMKTLPMADKGSLTDPGTEHNTTSVKKILPEKKEKIITPSTSTEKVENKSQDVKEAVNSQPVSAETIFSKLSIKTNKYEVGSFGGIRNLEITLHNESKYLLDKVTVELKYLNPEGVIIKAENIYFLSVPGGATEIVAVKKSKRGVKIDYSITKIESRETNSGTAGL